MLCSGERGRSAGADGNREQRPRTRGGGWICSIAIYNLPNTGRGWLKRKRRGSLCALSKGAHMLKTPILHPQILNALGRAGHSSKILIADGNYPFHTKRGPNANSASRKQHTRQFSPPGRTGWRSVTACCGRRLFVGSTTKSAAGGAAHRQTAPSAFPPDW